MFEQAIQGRSLDRAVQHRRSEVRQKCEPDPGRSELLQRRSGIRPCLEAQIRVEQLFAMAVQKLELQGLRRVDEPIFGHAHKVDIGVGNGAKPCVLELADAPEIDQFHAFSWKKRFGKYPDRPWIKDGKSIERHRLVARRSDRQGLCDKQAGRGSQSSVHNVPTVDNHGMPSCRKSVADGTIDDANMHFIIEFCRSELQKCRALIGTTCAMCSRSPAIKPSHLLLELSVSMKRPYRGGSHV